MKKSALRKDLNLAEIIALGIGTMIGGTVFSSLGMAVFSLGRLSLLSIILNSLIAILIGYNYAKLSTRYPSCGASYSFIAKAFPKNVLLKLATGYIALFAYASAISFYAVVFAHYIHTLLDIPVRIFSIVAIAIMLIVVSVIVNMMGVKKTGILESLLSYFKLSVLIIVILFGLLLLHDNLSIRAYDDATITITTAIKGILYGSVLTFLGFEGFETMANASEESREKHYVSKAIYLSLITVSCIYILTALLILFAISSNINKLSYVHVETLLSNVAFMAFGNIGKELISLCALVATISALNGSLYAVSRLVYAMSKDNILPGYFSKLNKHDVPYRSIILTGIISCLLIVFNQKVAQLSEITSLAFLSIFTITSFANLKVYKETSSRMVLCLLGTLFPLILMLSTISITPSTLVPFVLWTVLLTTVGLIIFIINRYSSSLPNHARVIK